MACAGHSNDWSEFRTPGADFVMSVPSKPDVYKDVIEKDGGVWRVYTVDQGGVAYSIDYYMSGVGRKAASLDARLDALRDGIARAMNGKLRNERRFSLGENRAAEVVIDVPETKDKEAYMIKARFYVRRDQAGRDISYKSWVVGLPGYDANPNAARFLDSFHFVAG
ncbi:MAG TPA: hypothetical protein VJO12_13210 [Stellaceae bacterium]|nr:hypothetical protein [Stellaceae bacterium]